jgi:hypothetical protein
MRRPTTRIFALTILSLTFAAGAHAADAETPAGGCPSAASLGFAETAVRTDTATVSVVARVSKAKVTRAQARRITMMNPVLSLVTVSGTTIRPIPGNSLWKLTNGAFALFDSEPTVNAMEVWTKDMGDGDLYVRACLCPGQNPNVDDGCKFSDGGNPTNPGSCGGNTCCDVVEGVILGNGTPITF